MRAGTGLAPLSAMIVALAAGCLSDGQFPCERDSKCVRNGKTGSCVQGSCAFMDVGCASGLRWDQTGAADQSGQCVPFTDAGAPEASTPEDDGGSMDLATPPDSTVLPHCRTANDCPRLDGGGSPECCAAACTDVVSDPANCGGCMMRCPQGAVCAGGVCTMFPSTGAEGAFAPTIPDGGVPVADGGAADGAMPLNVVLAPGIHNFTTINVPAGIIVTTTGSGVLDLRATGAVVIAGTIDVSGAPGQPGTGMGGGGGDTGNPLHSGNSDQGGGGGGGGGALAGGDADNGSGGKFGGGGSGGGGGGGGGMAGGGGGGNGAFLSHSTSCCSFSIGSANGAGGGAGGGGAAGGPGTSAPGSQGKANGAPYDGAGGSKGGYNSMTRSQYAQCCNGGNGGSQTLQTEKWGGGGGGGGSIGTLPASDLAVSPMTFQPGSGGGAGGGYAGGGGGGGGGVLRVASPISVHITGSLQANGGNGGGGACSCCTGDRGSGSGGGGSGGVIFLAAPSISVDKAAAVLASGGSGAAGPACENTGGSGGAGGLGRIRLSVDPKSCTMTGTLAPPLINGCVASPMGGTPGAAYLAPYPN